MLNERRKSSTFQVIKKILPMVIASSPKDFIFLSILSLISSGLFAFSTVATEKFFNSVAALAGGNTTMAMVILAALFLGTVLILTHFLNGLVNMLANKFFFIAAGYITNFVNEKASKIDPINFEYSETLDDINKAHIGVRGSIFFNGIINMMLTLYLPYFIFMGIYLYRLNPILTFSIILIFIPVALNQFIRLKIFTDLENQSANIRREFEYYEKCMIDREYYKETRLLGAFSYFKDLYSSALLLLNKKLWQAEKKANLIELGMKVFTLICYMGILYLLFTSLMSGKIGVGAFGAVLSAIGTMFSTMEEFICREVGDITKMFGAVRNLDRFLDLQERQGEPVEIEGVPNISLKNVGFVYPCASKPSLSNINLDISPKETIAIVGENGAGKSTLAKLILGLYLPTEGKVEFGGYDTKKISPESIYSKVSAVFQKYQKYKMTLSENVSISDIENFNNQKLKEVLEKADVELNKERFPDGLETMLSREFDGVDLSGGQWQRIAIARGLYAFKDIIILDEPTAAIDPLEESRIFNKFKELAAGRTAIIVTHRMGTVKIADRIIVMEDGSIKEIGSHEDLMQGNSSYKKMYLSQEKWYS
ncbi:ABC transporter ATP-binding protein [Clostridium chauvoei]|uniref:ABC transporter ATP-binding protein n=1 Tax=Clostridium chauvoei TaxID=46867 RepID=UPI001C85DF88|nr:ABC transporter ATP-binding protein [Clostridium chauvoei]MBX7375387.1 ABC transporter ATP-binding protein/permease [Clostridium chauvoei]